MATNGTTSAPSLINYVSFIGPSTGKSRIGHLDLNSKQITPLSYKSGSPLSTLYEVIEVGEKGIVPGGEPLALTDVKLQAPIYGRDVLAVGKNYSEHAKEFNSSGYDSSDKVDQPTHPVIFTKRATSIIADGEEIYPHPKFTDTVDYEGEIGVIVGKPGFRISEESAMDHVWGYTIINDVTARERQRDHKQFYIGKSPDTFCPMGPIAVPKEHLPEVLRVQTFVNGEKRQEATTKDLIFSVPFLIMTLSEGQTLQAGDVLATGTPAGVGFGQEPPVWLKPGDKVEVSVTDLGTLTNTIGEKGMTNETVARVEHTSAVPSTNTEKSLARGVALVDVGGKSLFYQKHGAEHGQPVLLIHGLGGTSDYFRPLVSTLQKSGTPWTLYAFDLEGHGLSPTSATSELSIASFAADALAVCQHANIHRGLTVIAHSMGCLVGMDLALRNPGLVQSLILMGPPPSPLPEAGAKATHARAALVREKGMGGVSDAILAAGTSEKTRSTNPMALTAVRLSLMGQDPEGYAKACSALANSCAEPLGVEQIKAKTLILTGAEDKVSPAELCRTMQARIATCEDVVVLQDVGHWHLFEKTHEVCDAVSKFLSGPGS